MPKNVFQSAVSEYLSEKVAAPAGEMIAALTAKGLAERQARGAINRMSKRGLLVPSAKGWRLAGTARKFVKAAPSKPLRSRVPSKERAMTSEMVKQLDLRINQADRSLSLNLEGWRITIGFDK